MRPRGTGARPSRALVDAVLSRAALSSGLPAGSIILSGQNRKAAAVRNAAWLEILSVSGCSMNGLADVWGCDRQIIWRVVKALPEAERPVTRASGALVAPRIVALGVQGWPAQRIAAHVGCSETYAHRVLNLWRAEGGEPIRTIPRNPPIKRYAEAAREAAA